VIGSVQRFEQRFQVASPSGLAEPDKRPSVTPPAWLAKRSISIYAGVIAASVMALVLVRLLPMVWFAPDSKLQTALSQSSSPDRRSKGDFAGKGMVPRAEVGEPDAGHVQAQTAPALEPTPRPPARSRTATAVRQEPQSDREAIADLPDLLKHGQALIAADKISEARQVLKTAAEAGSAPAALALGGTYDPTMQQQNPTMQQQNPTMQQRKALPLKPTASTVPGGSLVANKADITDITIARAWYEKARDLGSTEAAVRLERLAGRDGQLPRRAPPTVPKTDLPPQH
jgi:hypothetical protein